MILIIGLIHFNYIKVVNIYYNNQYFYIVHYLILFNNNIFLLAIVVWILSGLGVTAGLHRLWSHKSYKAKWPLRFILMLMSTIAFEVC